MCYINYTCTGTTMTITTAPLTVTFGKKSYPVASIEDAQSKWEAFRAEAARNGGGVRDIGNGVSVKQGGKIIGRISYNGRYTAA